MTRRPTKKFPAGWDEARVQRVLDHYESQSAEEAVAEDEASFEDAAAEDENVPMIVPKKLVPQIQALIAKYLKK
jgi:hypothetical protein